MLTWRVHVGSALDVLRTLPAGSVQCVVTSPPYWGLRDYGVEGQMGLEPTPDAYVAGMVEVFGEARRVLADDGVCWANWGDTYANTISATGARGGSFGPERGQWQGEYSTKSIPEGFKRKDLIGIPWRVAFALQADGWYLRSDVIWAKPNPMPESVQDRPTKAHEYVFLLTKSARYWYDADAIRENFAPSTIERITQDSFDQQTGGPKDYGDDSNRSARRSLKNLKTNTLKPYEGKATKDYESAGAQNPSETKARIVAAQMAGTLIGANARTVWTIATEPSSVEHFAVMPRQLARRCIVAGCPSGGTVLDPFTGAGTTGVVALEEGRQFVGIELNPRYAAIARQRLANVAPLLAREVPA